MIKFFAVLSLGAALCYSFYHWGSVKAGAATAQSFTEAAVDCAKACPLPSTGATASKK